MKYRRFEDLPVWQAAADLAECTDSLLQDRPVWVRGALRDQLGRASLSVSNNVAEGFERGTTKELINFLYIARGSAGEVRSMLTILDRIVAHRQAPRPASGVHTEPRDGQEIADLRSEISDVRSEIASLKALSESISRQLRAWAASLQEQEARGEITGQRHLTDAKRKAQQKRREREEFIEKLKRLGPPPPEQPSDPEAESDI